MFVQFKDADSVMGNEGSKDGRRLSDHNGMTSSFTSTSSASHRSSHATFPNCTAAALDEIPTSSLLHQCSFNEWKLGHAEAANFSDKIISCDRILEQDCEPSFCISKQNIINVEKDKSIFRFWHKMKFSKMSEHFEYNHIPAQMSSVNNFRVKRILCTKDSLVVLQLSQNYKCQLGLLNIADNKFKVFGKKFLETESDGISVALSPDNSKCLVYCKRSQCRISDDTSLSRSKLVPLLPISDDPSISRFFKHSGGYGGYIYRNMMSGDTRFAPSELLLFDSSNSMQLLSCIIIASPYCHFSFDPRFSWHQLAITDISLTHAENTLSIVSLTPPSSLNAPKETTCKSTQRRERSRGDVSEGGCDDGDVWLWTITSTNHQLQDKNHGHTTQPPRPPQQELVNLRHTKDGRLLVGTFLDNNRYSYRFRTNLYQPMSPTSHLTNCSLYVFSSDSAQTLRCVRFSRYICSHHTCTSNYLPLYSDCGSRIAVGVDDASSPHSKPSSPKPQFVQVYSLPANHFCLQALCRCVILQYGRSEVFKLKLPTKIVNYLKFCPEFNL